MGKNMEHEMVTVIYTRIRICARGMLFFWGPGVEYGLP